MKPIDERVTIALPYNDPSMSQVDIPKASLQHVYELPRVPAISNLDEAIQRVLKAPTGTPPLRELVRTARRIAIIVDDVTRPTPVARMLPAVLSELRAAGVKQNAVTLVIALGSHRPMTAAEVRAKVGRECMAAYRVRQSRFDDARYLVHVGRSEDGVDIFIDEEVARSDFKIGIGSIVPHGAVGWSGGAKIIYPGVAGKRTVTQFHFAHGLTETNLTAHAETAVRDRMERWVEVVGLQFIINCVLTPSSEVHQVVAGHFVAAHREGVRFAEQIYLRRFESLSDIVVSVSHPHDHDFWQAAKGFYGAEALAKDGGAVLVATPCYEGLGLHKSFPNRIGKDDNAQLIRAIMRGDAEEPSDPLPLAPAAMVARMKRRVQMHIVSPGLTDSDMHPAGIRRHENLQFGLEHLLARRPDAAVSVVLSADLAFKYERR